MKQKYLNRLIYALIVVCIFGFFQNCAKQIAIRTEKSELPPPPTTLPPTPPPVVQSICSGSAPLPSQLKPCSDGEMKAVQNFTVTCGAEGWKVENNGEPDYANCSKGCNLSEKPNLNPEQIACNAPFQNQRLALQNYKATCNSQGQWIKSNDGNINFSACPINCDSFNIPSKNRSCSEFHSDLVGTIFEYYIVSCKTDGQWSRVNSTSGGNYQCSCADSTKTYNQSTHSCTVPEQPPVTPRFGLALTSTNSGTMGTNAYIIKEPKLKYSLTGYANSFNLTLKNTGNTDCTLSKSETISTYNETNNPGFTANLSLDPTSKSQKIAKDATAIVTVNVMAKSYLTYVFNAANSGSLGSLLFKCQEDAQSTLQLAVALLNSVEPSSCAAGTCQTVGVQQQIYPPGGANTFVVPSGASYKIKTFRDVYNFLIKKGSQFETRGYGIDDRYFNFEGNSSDYFFSTMYDHIYEEKFLLIKDICGNISRISIDKSNSAKLKLIFKDGAIEILLAGGYADDINVYVLKIGNPGGGGSMRILPTWSRGVGEDYIKRSETSQAIFTCN